jgi:AraC-like DNA-binding protein
MKHLLPANHPTNRVQTGFSPFGGLGQNSELDVLLRSTEVTARTAIYYQCNGHYAMRERVIGDDMFYCITRGNAEARVEGKKYFLSAGQCAHFARGVRHAAFAVDFEVQVMHYDALVFGGLTLPRLLEFPPVFDFSLESPFLTRLNEMCRIYALQPAGWQPLFNAAVTQFLWNVIDRFLQPQILSWRDLERLLPALTHMQNDLANPLSIDQLAAKCHLSPAHFRRVFAQTMNTSPLQYLQQKRLEKAGQLLLHGSDTIESISAQVGYEDPSYFSHTFRRVMGLSPGKYRRQNVL